MRLLVFGQWSHTGFGVVTQALGERLVEAGVDIRIIADNHRGEPIQGPLAGRVWPHAALKQYVAHISGNAIMGPLWTTFDKSDNWKPDAVLAIADMSGLLGYIGQTVEAWRTLPVFHYCPIEGDNLPPAWKAVWEMVQPVAMARYGQQVISQFVGRPVPMIYHGVDTETFRPAKMGEPLIADDGTRISTKEAAKLHFGLSPSDNVILRSDRLVERKFYDRFVTAMAEVVRRAPNTKILLHCSMQDGMLDLYQELARHPDDILDHFRATNAHDSFRGLSRNELAILMNAADLYVTTTGGEGFGLNLAESLACEVPVISTGWAAEAEVVGPGGVLVPPLHDSYGEVVRYHSQYGMDWAVPDARGFVEPTLALLAKPGKRRALGDAGRRHVIANFSWDAAASAFLDLFEEPDVDRLAS